MTWPIAISLLAAILGGGGGLSAVLVYRRGVRQDSSAAQSGLIEALSARLSAVERELDTSRQWRADQEVRYSALWSYCRSLIDYAYRHRRDGSPAIPDMPDGLT